MRVPSLASVSWASSWSPLSRPLPTSFTAGCPSAAEGEGRCSSSILAGVPWIYPSLVLIQAKSKCGSSFYDLCVGSLGSDQWGHCAVQSRESRGDDWLLTAPFVSWRPSCQWTPPPSRQNAQYIVKKSLLTMRRTTMRRTMTRTTMRMLGEGALRDIFLLKIYESHDTIIIL